MVTLGLFTNALLFPRPHPAHSGTVTKNSASLCTGVKLNHKDRLLDEVEKDCFITLPGKGGHSRLLPHKSMHPPLERRVRCFIVTVQRGHDQLMDFILMGGR